jgi:hypothetical protein
MGNAIGKTDKDDDPTNKIDGRFLNKHEINESILGKTIKNILENNDEYKKRACCNGTVQDPEPSSNPIIVKFPVMGKECEIQVDKTKIDNCQFELENNKLVSKNCDFYSLKDPSKCKIDYVRKGLYFRDAKKLPIGLKTDASDKETKFGFCKIKPSARQSEADYYVDNATGDTWHGNEKCDSFYKQFCSERIALQGCVLPKEKGKGTWNNKNPTCFETQGNYANTLNTIEDDCACINSQGGYSLNTQNTGIDEQKFTYDVFGNSISQQMPQIFDTRCIQREKLGTSSDADFLIGKAYRLSPYYTKGLTICMNQINITGSNLNTANFSNIKQDNKCGGVAEDKKPEPVTTTPPPTTTTIPPTTTNTTTPPTTTVPAKPVSKPVEEKKQIDNMLPVSSVSKDDDIKKEKKVEKSDDNNLLLIGGISITALLLFILIIYLAIKFKK